MSHYYQEDTTYRKMLFSLAKVDPRLMYIAGVKLTDEKLLKMAIARFFRIPEWLKRDPTKKKYKIKQPKIKQPKTKRVSTKKRMELLEEAYKQIQVLSKDIKSSNKRIDQLSLKICNTETPTKEDNTEPPAARADYKPPNNTHPRSPIDGSSYIYTESEFDGVREFEKSEKKYPVEHIMHQYNELFARENLKKQEENSVEHRQRVKFMNKESSLE